MALAYAASTQATSGISVACNIQPRPTGQLFIGSSRQFNTVDPTVEPEVFTRVLKEAVDYFPALLILMLFGHGLAFALLLQMVFQ